MTMNLILYNRHAPAKEGKMKSDELDRIFKRLVLQFLIGISIKLGCNFAAVEKAQELHMKTDALSGQRRGDG
jgi:hypothetical protein